MLRKQKDINDCNSIYTTIKHINNKKDKNNNLYKIDYAFSYFFLQNNKSIIPAFISCRYLENYFKIQIKKETKDIYYKDLVTCLKERSFAEKGNNVFYTGVLNGNLYKKKKKSNVNFDINELKYNYVHKSAITVIELYYKKK